MTQFTRFFDRLEDRTRTRLSRYPIIYAFVGAVAIVLFWRSVWMIADDIPLLYDPYVSLVVSVVTLLLIGLFVSFFVGDSILLSGIKGEKKLIEKTEGEIRQEGGVLTTIEGEVSAERTILHSIQKELKDLRAIVEKQRN